MAVNPQFTLKAAAITAINGIGATMYMIARAEGENATKLDAALAGGTFNLNEQQRLQRICVYRLGLTSDDSFTSL